MDDADRADKRIEEVVAVGVAKCRLARSLVPCFRCHYCGEPIPEHHLFCTSECGLDWHKEQNIKRINGQ